MKASLATTVHKQAMAVRGMSSLVDLTKNTYCGLCMECIRTCPHDNIAVNLRPFSADLAKPSTRMDEAFKAFIMLGSAMIYAGVLLGPWGAFKDAAYNVGTSAWFIYAVIFLAIIFVILPGFFTLGILKTKSTLPLKQRFASLSTALIPLGLMFWVAFSLSFVLTNASYILAALSDPLGLGWNLFGTANTAWQPMLTSILAPAQTLALVGGLIWSARTAQKAANEVKVSSIPVIVYCFIAHTGHALVTAMKRSELLSRILIISRDHPRGWSAAVLLDTHAAYPRAAWQRMAAGIRMSFKRKLASRFI